MRTCCHCRTYQRTSNFTLVIISDIGRLPLKTETVQQFWAGQAKHIKSKNGYNVHPSNKNQHTSGNFECVQWENWANERMWMWYLFLDQWYPEKVAWNQSWKNLRTSNLPCSRRWRSACCIYQLGAAIKGDRIKARLVARGFEEDSLFPKQAVPREQMFHESLLGHFIQFPMQYICLFARTNFGVRCFHHTSSWSRGTRRTDI